MLIVLFVLKRVIFCVKTNLFNIFKWLESLNICYDVVADVNVLDCPVFYEKLEGASQ